MLLGTGRDLNVFGQHHRHAGMALPARAVEHLDALTHFRLAPDKNRCIPLFEGAQTRIRGLTGSPIVGFLGDDALDLEAVPEPLIAVFLLGAQVDELFLVCSPQGSICRTKISLPSMRASAISAKHHCDAK